MNFYKWQDSRNSFTFDYKFYDNFQNTVLFIYGLIITFLIGVIIIEVKHMYNIDIFPGIDTPFDNVYYQSLPTSIDNINYK
jgi:hypothetical protein